MCIYEFKKYSNKMLETDHKFASYFIASLNQVETTRATMGFGKELTLSQTGKENDIPVSIIKANSPIKACGDLSDRLVHGCIGGRGMKVTAKSSFPFPSNLPSTVISLPELSNLYFSIVKLENTGEGKGRNSHTHMNHSLRGTR